MRPKIWKLCVVRIYTNIDEAAVVVVEIEWVLEELEGTPYEPMREEQDEMASKEFATYWKLLALNETLINIFGKGSDGQVGSNTKFSTNSKCCQLC